MNSEFHNTNQTENMPKSKKGTLIFTVLTVVFCLVIFGIGAANLISPDRDFSDSENRVLTKMPVLSFFSLTEGTFMKDFETYLTDQFIFRDEIIGLKTFFDRISGKKEVGGVYIGSDGYLFAQPTPFNEERVGEITEALNSFAEGCKESKITFMLSPNSSFINSDKLPAYLSLEDQSARIDDIQSRTASENIAWINLSETFLSLKDETQLFYKTDHHWTTRAAYAAMERLMTLWEKSTGEGDFRFFTDTDGSQDAFFRFLTVADDFQGTLSSKAGITSSSDIIEICVPANSALSYVVNYESQDKKTVTLFDESKLSQKNKYEVFMGGNFDKITVDTTSSSKDTLLLIKDSYANCMIPMLTPFFAKIVIVDPRYSRESLKSIVEENSFTHILFLYNLNTLLEDTSLADCLR